MTKIDNAGIGRRLSTWRRLMLLFGPAAAKKVGLALAEFAWPDKDDPDAELVARNCPQEMLCHLCDYTVSRGLRKQLAVLENAGWIERDDDQTGPRRYREYVLMIPDSVPRDAIAAMTTPSKGMWKRAAAANTQRTGELQFPCSQDVDNNIRGTSVPAKPISGEPQFHIRGTSVPDQGNLSSPLKESLSSSLGAGAKEGRQRTRNVPDMSKTKLDSPACPQCQPIAEAAAAAKIATAASQPTDREFETFKKAYPKRAGSQPWSRARKAIHARLKDGNTMAEILAGAQRYRAYAVGTDKEGTEFVLQAATFCGPEKHFLAKWELPATEGAGKTKRQRETTRQFLTNTEDPDRDA